MRLKASDSERDSVEIISVLARPGTPSRMQWPLLKSAISSSSMTWSWPTMIRLNCCLMSLKAPCSRRTASRSSCRSSSPGSAAPSGMFANLGLNAGSLIRFSSSRGWGLTDARPLPLVNGQGRVVQLQDADVDGGDEHGADVAAGPAAVGALAAHEVLERLLAVLAPGHAL